jgi:hypothetical protein
MSLYSPESATLSIADPCNGLATNPRAAVQTAIDPLPCRTAASPASPAEKSVNPDKPAMQSRFSRQFPECHDSYVAVPYRNFRSSPQIPLTTLSF